MQPSRFFFMVISDFFYGDKGCSAVEYRKIEYGLRGNVNERERESANINKN